MLLVQVFDMCIYMGTSAACCNTSLSEYNKRVLHNTQSTLERAVWSVTIMHYAITSIIARHFASTSPVHLVINQIRPPKTSENTQHHQHHHLHIKHSPSSHNQSCCLEFCSPARLKQKRCRPQTQRRQGSTSRRRGCGSSGPPAAVNAQRQF